jgi:hypothetical protein
MLCRLLEDNCVSTYIAHVHPPPLSVLTCSVCVLLAYFADTSLCVL